MILKNVIWPLGVLTAGCVMVFQAYQSTQLRDVTPTCVSVPVGIYLCPSICVDIFQNPRVHTDGILECSSQWVLLRLWMASLPCEGQASVGGRRYLVPFGGRLGLVAWEQ